jgi:hypothetical protein
MQVRVLKTHKKILLKIPPNAKRITRSALKSYLMLMMYFQIQIRKLSMIRSGPRSGEVETRLTMDKGHREAAVIITGTNMIPLRRNIRILMTATEIKEKLTRATPTQILTKGRKEVLTTKMNNKGMNTTQAMDYIEEEFPVTDERDEIVTFIRESGRGIIKRFSKTSIDEDLNN